MRVPDVTGLGMLTGLAVAREVKKRSTAPVKTVG